MSNGDKAKKEQLLQLVQAAIQHDTQLREQYQIGEKFRFVRDRLTALAVEIEAEIAQMQEEIVKKTSQVKEDDVLVYVHLFNAQGIIFQTWNKMVAPAVFYEYSVNRPIYTDKAAIESLVRSRQNRAQHGILTVIIKKQDILPTPEDEEPVKDVNGSQLVKIREGSLSVSRMVSFTHQEQDYVINDNGQLTKKIED